MKTSADVMRCCDKKQAYVCADRSQGAKAGEHLNLLTETSLVFYIIANGTDALPANQANQP